MGAGSRATKLAIRQKENLYQPSECGSQFLESWRGRDSFLTDRMIREVSDGRGSLREDFGADELRWLAARAKDATQARRLLALAAVREGMNRIEAARIGGMDRQTLRD